MVSTRKANVFPLKKVLLLKLRYTICFSKANIPGLLSLLLKNLYCSLVWPLLPYNGKQHLSNIYSVTRSCSCEEIYLKVNEVICLLINSALLTFLSQNLFHPHSVWMVIPAHAVQKAGNMN